MESSERNGSHRSRRHDDERRERRDRERRRSRERRSRRYDDYYDEPRSSSRYRDPYYERYLEMRYMEERLAERYHAEMERYYSTGGGGNFRYPPRPPPIRGAEYQRDHTYFPEDENHYLPSRYASDGRGYGALGGVAYARYDRPRDDTYEQQRGGAYDDYYN